VARGKRDKCWLTMQAMYLNFALAQKENTSFTVDMRVIFHNNEILNDSL